MKMILQIDDMELCVGPAQLIQTSDIDAHAPYRSVGRRTELAHIQFIFFPVILSAELISFFPQFLPDCLIIRSVRIRFFH